MEPTSEQAEQKESRAIYKTLTSSKIIVNPMYEMFRPHPDARLTIAGIVLPAFVTTEEEE